MTTVGQGVIIETTSIADREFESCASIEPTFIFKACGHKSMASMGIREAAFRKRLSKTLGVHREDRMERVIDRDTIDTLDIHKVQARP